MKESRSKNKENCVTCIISIEYCSNTRNGFKNVFSLKIWIKTLNMSIYGQNIVQMIKVNYMGLKNEFFIILRVNKNSACIPTSYRKKILHLKKKKK